MTKELWINLPVKDIQKSRNFFTAIGFSFKPGPGNTETSACMVVGNKNIIIMLFESLIFKGFINHNITDTNHSNEVLFSIDAESRNEVDVLTMKVKNAGGNVFSEPKEHQGWMYGCGFSDLDGHRWNVLFMDINKRQMS